ncbi:MAG: BlaI/MecI/CopY family transcriptional regulator [Planctomycetia bacterium]|nr:BlaI/MecI/CopY family transcriptional regulator [Planctomycetia bacterium]
MKNPTITEAEWEVMNVLWSEGPSPTRKIHASLSRRKQWAINTVKTLLLRLVHKGAVDYDQIGNSYLYKASVSRESMTKREVKEFVDRVFDGSFSPFLAHFVANENFTDEEFDQMQQLISERRKQSGSRKGHE